MRSEGWAWVQLSRDGYVGYMPSEGLAATIIAPTHRIAALRTYVYPAPDIKTPAADLCSVDERNLRRQRRGRALPRPCDRRLRAVPCMPAGSIEHVPTISSTSAAAFAGTPYLWGGRSSLGVDCSGLVQLACEAAGIACPRDADMQATELGDALRLARGRSLKRGDLVFWDGHVGIMADATRLLHASAYQMAVVVEPLAEAQARIAASGGGEIVVARRLPD